MVKHIIIPQAFGQQIKIEQTTDSQLGRSCCPHQDDVKMNIPQAARTPIAVLCFLLVSGFIYYSIRLNHWISWIPLSHDDYNRLGFVANLESTYNSVLEKKTDLPNNSVLPCVGGETQRRMQEIFPKFSQRGSLVSEGGQSADHEARGCSRLISMSRRWGWARHLPGGWPDGGHWNTGGRWTQQRAAPAHAPIPDLT
uniref:Uncharacterized protein n=2 Tax=Eptatretus burgeri TaxID=7764 RepID=A0A8C4QL28_EPTBU